MRALRIAGGVALCIGIAAYAFWSYLQQRHDLPAFDRTKAAALTPEKRAEYERKLFNELPYWNAGTPRHDLWSREAEWKEMAADGYELAYITLQVLSPVHGRYSLDKPLKRLTELADGGDVGAMCLWFPLAAYGTYDQALFNARYLPQAMNYVRRGANAGHPECLKDEGYRLMLGLDGFQRDRKAGFDRLVRSEQLGYSGSLSLLAYFENYAGNSSFALERSFCWGSVASKYSVNAGPDRQRRRIQQRGFADRQEEDHLIAKTKDWRPTIADCAGLGLEN